jgi:PKD repeat protein
MDNESFPKSLATVVAAAILGSLIAVGLVVALMVSAAVPQTACPLSADFTAAAAGNNQVLFSADATTGGSQPHTKYEWDFDNDGTVDNDDTGAAARDIAHEYDAPGTYIVKLTVTDAEDNTDSKYSTVVVV